MVSDTKDKLDAAFRKLKVLPEMELRLGSVIRTLASLAGKDHLRRAPGFLAISRVRAQGELSALMRQSVALADYLDSLHEPVILGLANAGVLVREWARELRAKAAKAEKADLNGAPDKTPRGRPPKRVAEVVTEYLAENYRVLTGDEPTISTKTDWGSKAYGPFLDFVTEVFKILQVRASPEAMVRAVLSGRVKRRKAQAEAPP